MRERKLLSFEMVCQQNWCVSVSVSEWFEDRQHVDIVKTSKANHCRKNVSSAPRNQIPSMKFFISKTALALKQILLWKGY